MRSANLQVAPEGHGQRIPRVVDELEVAGTQDQCRRVDGGGVHVIGGPRTDVAIGAVDHEGVSLKLVTEAR